MLIYFAKEQFAFMIIHAEEKEPLKLTDYIVLVTL